MAAAATVTVVGSTALGYFALFPQQAPAFVRTTLQTVGILDLGPEAEAPTPTCPLTGETVSSGKIPARPVLAVKIENLDAARPQIGLQSADIVYEEPVEGGITRFIVLYQCADEPRVGPVRSAREVDAAVLAQFGVPILAFSGASQRVELTIEAAELRLVDESNGGEAFTRDDTRVAPHNLYADPNALYAAGDAGTLAPAPVFVYSDEIQGRARRARSVHLPFSLSSDVFWKWNAKLGAWVRSHGTEPHLMEDGEQVSAANVVVQEVPVTLDPSGGPTPHVDLIGQGRAYVFRDGRVIVGTWHRDSLGEVTTFLARDGSQIRLAPGRTWVELFPASIGVTIG